MEAGYFVKSLLWILVISSCLMKYKCEECPLRCFCSSIEGSGSGTQLMSCVGVFPSRLPRTIDELVITDANISSLTADDVVPLGNLSSLHITSSCISSIAENAFAQESILSLKDLHLSNNEINSLKIRTFAHLSQIAELFLDGNSIRSITGVLSHLTTLRVLHLENNYLEEIPNDLPLSLTNLFLNNNNIHTVNFNGLSYISLQQLDLCGNSFARLSYKNISIPESLENLCLGNQFYDIDPKIFSSNRSSLRSLILKTTKKLTPYALDAINTFHELKSLTISGVTVSKFPGWAFKVLPKLESLSLIDMKCSPAIDEQFFSFEFLRELDLSGSPDISKTVLNNQAFLENLRYLQILKFRGTSLTAISDDLMPVIQRLEQLDISNNHLSCDCNLYNIIQITRRGNLSLLSPEQTICVRESTQETYIIVDKRLHFDCSETENDQPKSFDEAPKDSCSSMTSGFYYAIVCLVILITVLFIIIFYLLIKYLKVLRWKRCTVSTIF